MPIYEYVCSGCHQRFELLRSLSQANDEVSCPHCHNKAERIFSTFCSRTKSESGLIAPVGGSSCSSCSAGSCTSCGF